MIPTNKKIHIIGGGTVFHVRPHLALSAPAYGATARQLADLCRKRFDQMDTVVHLTKMANQGQGNLETQKDVQELVNNLVADYSTKIIFMTTAFVDYSATINDEKEDGKYGKRLNSSLETAPLMQLSALPKVIKTIREKRKDIFLIGFKTTSGANEVEQYQAALHLVKANSCNLVFANDVKTRLNIVVTPEESRHHVTMNRVEALEGLIEMTYYRSQLTFTRSTVVAGNPVPWDSPDVPTTLRTVVNYCIQQGAYKVFRGVTAGHFAIKLNNTTFLTSRRKTNFNELDKVGLVKVVTDGPDSVIAYGSKPSVGGQSQRIVFENHSEYDCIVHFHCPKKKESLVPTVSQREFECGSHECGKNTSNGLKKFGNLSAVFLDEHGPNIVFNSNIDPNEVISFIDKNFDLREKTGGLIDPS